jgi:hypothetical protein
MWVRRLNQWDTALRCEQKISSLLLLKHCAVAGLKERFEKGLTWKQFATLGRNVVNGNCMMACALHTLICSQLLAQVSIGGLLHVTKRRRFVFLKVLNKDQLNPTAVAKKIDCSFIQNIKEIQYLSGARHTPTTPVCILKLRHHMMEQSSWHALGQQAQ